MTSKTWNPQAFLASLSVEVEAALASHLGLARPQHGRWQRKHKLALERALAQELLPVLELSAPYARPYLVALAHERWQHERPSWRPFIASWSTADLAVRLCLEDPAALAAAHHRYQAPLNEPVRTLQSAALLDVVPSLVRRNRLKRALRFDLEQRGLAQRFMVTDWLGDESVAFFVCEPEAAPPRTPACGVRAGALPDFRSGAVFSAIVCHSELTTLHIKAKSRAAHAFLEREFADVFLGSADALASQPPEPRVALGQRYLRTWGCDADRRRLLYPSERAAQNGLARNPSRAQPAQRSV